ncbi:hypothetical protein AB0A63_31230 [Lentzea sp. NPDC042327]|uniref:hypothetical protein n=1 Tax=Lentzea sp. NPDC042327 TaxID=3154801 RepID=UPI0033DDB5EA
MKKGFSTDRLTSSADGGDDALIVFDRLLDAFPDLERQAHEVRCRVADLLDNQVSSRPLGTKVVADLLARIEYLASVLGRSITGYGQALPQDQPWPEIFHELDVNGWREQDPRETDGHVTIAPSSKIGDRPRGRRRVFKRCDQQIMVFFTAPDVVAHAWTGTSWITDIEELSKLISSEPVDLGRLVAQYERERIAELKRPFALTVEEIIDRAVACRWELVRDYPCTESGIVGMPEINRVPKGDRPGRSVTLKAHDRDISVTAWGLPGQPASGVRYWAGRVRNVEQLNRILGYTEPSQPRDGA